MTCDCTKYNGGPCYNCLNGAHSICDSGQGECNLTYGRNRFEIWAAAIVVTLTFTIWGIVGWAAYYVLVKMKAGT